MNMPNVFESLWNKLNGYKLMNAIFEADELICQWLDVYRGAQPWLDYDYVDLTGTKRKRTRLTMNAAKIACGELSRLVWAEMPELNSDQSVIDYLDSQAFWPALERYSEYGAAGGGFAMKLFSPDGQTLKIDYVPADCFIPVSWNSKMILEADFLDRMSKDGKTYIRVEKHRMIEGGYEITSEAWEDVKGVMHKVKLSTIGLEALETAVTFQTPVPLFAYVPYPGANNINLASPLGISMYANALGTLEALDVAFDGLHSEIMLGKKRIIVPASAVRSVMDTETQKRVKYFNPTDEVFVSFDMQDAENAKIIDNSVEIRVEEIKEAINVLLNIYCNQIGFSAGTMSFDGQSMKTATEVISESSKTFRTKQMYENSIGRGVMVLLEAIRAIGPKYGIQTTGAEYSLTWNDSIIEDRNSKTNYWLQRYAQGTALLEDVLKELDGLTDDEAKSKAAEIRAGRATINVSSLFGGGE
jgi:A118 family predicted phage portal protein